MKKINNDKHIEAVVRAIYRDAADQEWENRTFREHTEQYGRWMADPNIGGVLTEWMSPEDARVWLKDTPMKEYSRALAGKGPFAKFLDSYPRSAESIVKRALGPTWSVVTNSTGVKPLTCLATDGVHLCNLFWGKSSDAKHLVWAALRVSVGTGPRCRIAICDTVAGPVSDEQKNVLTKIAGRCGIELTFVRL